jgi:hypothetical protein
MDSAMVILLLVLGGIMVYMVFSPTSLIGPWLDRYSKKEKEQWTGETIEPEPQPIKKKVQDTKQPKKKRVYKRKRKGK